MNAERCNRMHRECIFIYCRNAAACDHQATVDADAWNEDGRIHVEKVNAPFLREGGPPDELASIN